MWFMQNAMAKPDNAGAGSTDYMHLFGLVAHGLYVGADGRRPRMPKKAQATACETMDAKLLAGRFFMERMMPETASLARISAPNHACRRPTRHPDDVRSAARDMFWRSARRTTPR